MHHKHYGHVLALCGLPLLQPLLLQVLLPYLVLVYAGSLADQQKAAAWANVYPRFLCRWLMLLSRHEMQSLESVKAAYPQS